MHKILQELYDGKIYPAEQYRPMIEEHIIALKNYRHHYKDFAQKLGSPLDKEFDRIMDEQFSMMPHDFCQSFIDGFRLGAKMIIEIYADDIQKSNSEKKDE